MVLEVFSMASSANSTDAFMNLPSLLRGRRIKLISFMPSTQGIVILGLWVVVPASKLHCLGAERYWRAKARSLSARLPRVVTPWAPATTTTRTFVLDAAEPCRGQEEQVRGRPLAGLLRCLHEPVAVVAHDLDAVHS
jgi:hypothetical protein